MDKNNLSQLDPKLREAYERVMGTNVAPAQPAPASPSDPIAAPSATTPVQPLQTSTGPTLSTAAPASTEPQPQTTFPNGNPAHTVLQPAAAPVGIQKTVGVKKKGVNPAVIFLLLLIFFAIYGVIWVRVFNLKVPFLNP